jgi:hypothetical protein
MRTTEIAYLQIREEEEKWSEPVHQPMHAIMSPNTKDGESLKDCVLIRTGENERSR